MWGINKVENGPLMSLPPSLPPSAVGPAKKGGGDGCGVNIIIPLLNKDAYIWFLKVSCFQACSTETESSDIQYRLLDTVQCGVFYWSSL